jgi:hypothetical protein
MATLARRYSPGECSGSFGMCPRFGRSHIAHAHECERGVCESELRILGQGLLERLTGLGGHRKHPHLAGSVELGRLW